MAHPASFPAQQPAWPPAPPTIQSSFGAPSSYSPASIAPQPVAPFGYGVGPQTFSLDTPPVNQQPPPRRRWLLAGTGALAAAVVAGAAVGGWWFVNADNESDAIVALVPKFAAAADTGDPAAVVDYLCTPEAEALKAAMRVRAGTPGPTTAKAGVGATDVVVKGELASAMLTESGQTKTTIYFRKESGQWKVCMSAQRDFAGR